jgi:hypothetical protein
VVYNSLQLIKIQKNDAPKRPVINLKHAVGYKLSKLLTHVLAACIEIPNAFNIKNTPSVIRSLKDVSINKGIRLASLDIKNMYTNPLLTSYWTL